MTVENVYVPYDQTNSKVVNAAGSQTGPDVGLHPWRPLLALGGGLKPTTTSGPGTRTPSSSLTPFSTRR